ncbi:hypothetical protein GKZ89_11170 [Bacillus mangrovi]|uniref:Lipoprotein n=1 Tax=Metabacillus mangrovi TaxID=1491830 RepID=A0A7X2V4N6_9BACI|nr:hypothetical protein [Metabacillus mangrovi]MTH53967.1 hypothetical protein [Metabacillus mangrovi]
MKKKWTLLTGLILTAGLTGCADDPDREEENENPPVEQENYDMEMKDGNMSPDDMRNGRYPSEQDGEMDRETERQKEEKMKKEMMD